ncbi:helix-turn-helix domain-containing protein [Nonomuraea sp. NPDC049725]|uniref:TetR/AcrR family transcriptional regulator n=1 Tax=Nonomuraea sp. NPDC049725 TaxID=3154508 RepID=UPI0034477A04
MMAGLRELKKERTRRHLAEVALRLFDERGYDAVTVNEIAEAAGVAKVTLFNYFPSKDCLVLDGVADDTAAVVAGRPEGQPPLAALREHYRRAAAGAVDEIDVGHLLTQVRVIAATPALMAGVYQAHLGRRYELAAALAADVGEALAPLLAGQITAALTTLQESFFQRLAAGTPLEEARRLMAADVELAFDLLENGIKQ